jgi:hypothetical protein
MAMNIEDNANGMVPANDRITPIIVTVGAQK